MAVDCQFLDNLKFDLLEGNLAISDRLNAVDTVLTT